MEVPLHLRELLAIPYLVEAEAVEREPGQWLIRLAYPELPGCAAEGAVVEHARLANYPAPANPAPPSVSG
jgi:hypothetical protein